MATLFATNKTFGSIEKKNTKTEDRFKAFKIGKKDTFLDEHLKSDTIRSVKILVAAHVLHIFNLSFG